MASNDVMKVFEVNAPGGTISGQIGAEAQNIDVSFDNQGNIVEDITGKTGLEVQSLSTTLKNIKSDTDDAVMWEEENELGAKNFIPIGTTIENMNGIKFEVATNGMITISGRNPSAIASFRITFPEELNDAYIFTIGDKTDTNRLDGKLIVKLENSSDATISPYFDGNGTNNSQDKQLNIPINSHIKYFDIVVNTGSVSFTTPFTIKPMLRPSVVKNRTYASYAMSNRQLTNKVNNLHTTFAELDDTSFDNLKNGQFVQYNSNNQTWENKTLIIEDKKVEQIPTTTDANFEVLFSGSANDDTSIEGAGKDYKLRYNPSRGSLMEGYHTVAFGNCSHAEGWETSASYTSSHAEGYQTSASGYASHAEGNTTIASGSNSHAEGWHTSAFGPHSHTEGYETWTRFGVNHAEGYKTFADNNYSHAEGSNTTASGDNSHTEGEYTIAAYANQHVQGKYNSNKSNTLFEIGNGTAASAKSNAFEVYNDGNLSTDNGTTKVKLENLALKSTTVTSVKVGSTSYSPSNGVISLPAYPTDTNNAVTQTADDSTNSNFEVLFSNTADNTTRTEGARKSSKLRYNASKGSLMEGNSTTASGINSHAEGYKTYASGGYSHAEGTQTYASADYGSHAEGYHTSASGTYGSHAEGYRTSTSAQGSHAEGYSTCIGYIIASGQGSHAEGYTTTSPIVASANGAHAEGQGTTAAGSNFPSHAEGRETYADGDGSHAEGCQTSAYAAHAEGWRTSASGESSHAEGNQTTSQGLFSHAEGHGTIASNNSTHAEGAYTKASGEYAHAEGSNTSASGQASHAEGNSTSALGKGAHAEGTQTCAFGESAHAEGYDTLANGTYTHTEGYKTSATGLRSHAEGDNTIANGHYSHAEGHYTTASGTRSHAEGYQTSAAGNYSHAEGYGTSTSGYSSHAEGYGTYASGDYSHAEGLATCALDYSHAEGYQTSAAGNYSHAEGYNTEASSMGAHAEGYCTIASGDYSHAEGGRNILNAATIASGAFSHAEGRSTTSSGTASHAEGSDTNAGGLHSHTEGYNTIAIEENSHAEGQNTLAFSKGSHAEGFSTTAGGSHQEIPTHTEIVSSQPTKTTAPSPALLDPTGAAPGTTSTVISSWEVPINATNIANIQTSIRLQIPQINVGLNTGDFVFVTEEGMTSIASLNSTYDFNGLTFYKRILAQPFHAVVQNKYTSRFLIYLNGYYFYDLTMQTSSNKIIFSLTLIRQYTQFRIEYGEDLTWEGGLRANIVQSTLTLTKQSIVLTINDTPITVMHNYTHAEGMLTQASGSNSHAEGNDTSAFGKDSHAEGNDTQASGIASHAEGKSVKASGGYSHAEGKNTSASGESSHAEGDSTIAVGKASHAAGIDSYASDDYSYAIGMKGRTNNRILSSKGDHYFAIGGYRQQLPDIEEGNYMDSSSNNIFSVDSLGNFFSAGAHSLASGTFTGSITTATGPIIPLEDGALYLLYGHAKRANGAQQGAQAILVAAGFNPTHAEGFMSTASTATPTTVSLGASGSSPFKIGLTNYQDSNGFYHGRLHLGSGHTTTTTKVRWNLVKVLGSLNDF